MKTKTVLKEIKTIWLITLLVIIIAGACDEESDENNNYENIWNPVTENVKGTLETINGINIMKLWGTNYEQGYANGYLNAPNILHIMNEVIKTEFKGITSSYWENKFMESLEKINMPDRFISEFQGVFDGINARAEGNAFFPVLKRDLKLEDILIMNCFSEILSFNCSSFAVWGDLTEDGNAIVGKNNDWFITSALEGISQILCVRKQNAGSGIMNTISFMLPGSITIGTGLNSDGVIVLFHDAQGLTPTQATIYDPMVYSAWEALESSKSTTGIDDFNSTLKSHHVYVTQNFMVGIPNDESNFDVCVFECDGNKNVEDGVTIRYPEDSDDYIICTNHFRERIEPVSCWRYNKILENIEEIKNSGGTEFLTVQKAWDMLSEVPIEGSLVYHSIVYEPAKGLIHVAVSKNQVHAPDCDKVTFSIEDLFGNLN